MISGSLEVEKQRENETTEAALGRFEPGTLKSLQQLGSEGHLQKLCKLFPQALIYLKGAMLICRLTQP